MCDLKILQLTATDILANSFFEATVQLNYLLFYWSEALTTKVILSTLGTELQNQLLHDLCGHEVSASNINPLYVANEILERDVLDGHRIL